MTALKILGALVLVAALVGIAALAYVVGAWVLGLAAALIAWWGCVYVAFSRSPLRTIVRVDNEGQGSSFQVSTWRYPYWRSWALLGAVIIPILAMVVALLPLMDSDGLQLAPKAGTATAPVPAASAVAASAAAASATVSSPSHTATPEVKSTTPSVATQTRTAIPETDTPKATSTEVAPSRVPPTDTATLMAPPEEPPTNTPRAHTPTSTPTFAPSVVPRTFTPTASPTLTPTVPSDATPLPLVAQPIPLVPLQGREYKNPVSFIWDGTLYAGQSYRVSVRHVVSGDFAQSAMLTDREWVIDLPAHRFGEWRWEVAVVGTIGVVSTSPERSFWFNPLPGTRRASPTPSHTPQGAPAP